MNKKHIWITGGTGGIGKELVKQLIASGKYIIHLVVRSMERAKDFYHVPDVYIEVRDIGDHEDIAQYCQFKEKQGVVFDYVLHLAGDLKYDSEFPGVTKEEQEKNSVTYHTKTNVVPMEIMITVLQKVYGTRLAKTILLAISSWAANFEVGHPYREDEEGYVISKALLSAFLKDVRNKNIFKEVFIEEPALIRSPLTERKFPHLLADPNVPKLEADDYAKHIIELLAL